MRGLLQDSPLTIRWLFERMERIYPERTVASARDGRTARERSWSQIAARARRLSSALDAAGVGPGERVATFAFNSDDHLEQMLGIMASGRVYHALNPRLSTAELTYTLEHARDALVFVDEELLDKWREIGPAAQRCKQIVVTMPGSGSAPGSREGDYESFLESASEPCLWPELDEKEAAALCYTSGTTGPPKGVLYSHRGLVLVALAWMLPDAAAISQKDCFLPVVPFFHAQAWALPLAATLAGCRIVLTGSDLSPLALAALTETERVTLAAGVPTIWRSMLDALEDGQVSAASLASLERIICGGSAVPQDMLRAYDALGVQLIQVWGMTEMSPLGTVSRVRREVEANDALRVRAMQGQPSPLVSLRIVGEDGSELPWDGQSAGEIQSSGPWIADAYLDPDAPDGCATSDGFVTDESGRRWLRTGDIATIDPLAHVKLVDRAKDLIKSGGEWISSVQLEQIIETHPAVSACAVVAVAHPKWDERPLAVVQLRNGQAVAPQELLDLVGAQLASWQVPDAVEFVDELPRNSIGKIDKRALREAYASVTPQPELTTGDQP